jgi:hypothetical protein
MRNFLAGVICPQKAPPTRAQDSSPASPSTRTGVGNLGTAELYSIAYDDLNHAILAGAHDNGGIEQIGPLWAQVNPRDGVGRVLRREPRAPGEGIVLLR